MQLIVNDLEQERLRAAVEPDPRPSVVVGSDDVAGSAPIAGDSA